MFGRAVVASFLFLVLASTAQAQPNPRQVERFWTPARMAAARPLELTVGRDGRADVHLGPRSHAATASYSTVESPEVPPYAWNGRLYVRQAGKEGFCSATAIDSPTRRLVLTAGHCVNSGPKDGKPGVWSTYLEFVPGLNLGAAPFGTFVLSGRPLAPPGWTKEGNPDFDLGAFLTEPNAEGAALADAVGGGATIVADQGRRQRFEAFGYPGGTERMRTCVSGFAGEDPVTATLPGPSTFGVRCNWAPGASGSGWLIDGGSEIDGLTSYITEGDGTPLTYGPYFSATTIGRLVIGL
ncbi:MAG: trypsin-like serine peptidase [Solirubrobacterales bacterium]